MNDSEATTGRRWLSVAEVASTLGFSANLVRGWCVDRVLVAARFGESIWRIEAKDLEAFISEARQEADRAARDEGIETYAGRLRETQNRMEVDERVRLAVHEQMEKYAESRKTTGGFERKNDEG